MQAAGYGAYRRIQAETASPGELVVMLYNGLVNDLERAREALERNDAERAHGELLRAQEIVMELVASLDRESGELAERLAALYQYLYERLVAANLRKDVAAVREVAQLVAPIRDAWVGVVQRGTAAPASAQG